MLKNFVKKIILGVAFASIFTGSVVYADIEDLTIQTGCSDQPSYTGLLELERGSYDVYVRLAKRGESATVNVYTQNNSQAHGECTTVGSVTASGDRWTKASSFVAEDLGSHVVQLSSPALANIPDANRPSIMLVPHEDPVCAPTIECEVTVDGQMGYVRPTGVLLNQDSLRVLKVVSPGKDTVKEVKYFVDSKLMYTSTSLTPFDMRYVLYPNQALQRVIVYESGQQVVLESKSPDSHVGSFGDYLFVFSRAYPAMYQTLAWALGAFSVLLAVYMIVHLITKHRTWQYAHGFLREETPLLTPAQQQLIYMRHRAMQWLGWGVVVTGTMVGMGIVIVLLNTYIIQIFTVDGRSMQRTLKTGDQVLINKFAKTFAGFNHGEYLPHRGEIVVVRGVFGNATLTDESLDQGNELYLIKRVIGLPGERVVVKNGTLTVYNREHPKGFEPDKGSRWEKTMISDLPSENLDVQLSFSELFVSGDNRPESIDSRFNGPLATKEVIGPMLLRVWPWK